MNKPELLLGLILLVMAAAPVVGLSVISYNQTSIYYIETGLPSGGSTWSVNVGGQNYTAPVGTMITVRSLVSSDYVNYTIEPVTSGGTTYYAAPSEGSTYIYNTISIHFSAQQPAPTRYSWEFVETGLSILATWSVTMDGQTVYAEGTSSLEFMNLPAGAYAFTVVPPSGWNVSPESGTASVTSDGSTPLVFTQQAISSNSTSTTTTTGSGSGSETVTISWAIDGQVINPNIAGPYNFSSKTLQFSAQASGGPVSSVYLVVNGAGQSKRISLVNSGSSWTGSYTVPSYGTYDIYGYYIPA
ncbi:MAG: hypothetical protein JRM78_04240, partial [Nitrososphaerota archaeon]|nr:hypothetical protein [Nitrososphaerota archaeon]